jgi:Cys-rich protein (TIGR01571 family)
MSGSWLIRKRDCFGRGWGPFCCAFWCPSCVLAEAKHRVDDSGCCFNWLCMFGPAARNEIRMNYELDGSVCEDVWYTCCCPPCAAVQVFNEASTRGPVRGRKVTRSFKDVSASISAFGPVPVVGPAGSGMPPGGIAMNPIGVPAGMTMGMPGSFGMATVQRV